MVFFLFHSDLFVLKSLKRRFEDLQIDNQKDFLENLKLWGFKINPLNKVIMGTKNLMKNYQDIEKKRAEIIDFSNPYVNIDANFLLRKNSEIIKNNDVDNKNNKIAVVNRSAYDLWLSDNFKKASDYYIRCIYSN